MLQKSGEMTLRVAMQTSDTGKTIGDKIQISLFIGDCCLYFFIVDERQFIPMIKNMEAGKLDCYFMYDTQGVLVKIHPTLPRMITKVYREYQEGAKQNVEGKGKRLRKGLL